MTDKKETEVKDEALNQISGGNQKEIEELREFIKKHDPSAKDLDAYAVFEWLGKKSGIHFRSLNVSYSYSNDIELEDGTYCDHASLMKRLKERFPD